MVEFFHMLHEKLWWKKIPKKVSEHSRLLGSKRQTKVGSKPESLKGAVHKEPF
jgi:hypothetical protein